MHESVSPPFLNPANTLYVCEETNASQHPHLTPAETWKEIVEATEKSTDQSEYEIADELRSKDALFTPSRVAGHEEILRLLWENEKDEITIVAVGPLTNCAMAAAQDPETFLKVKEVIVMGGNVHHDGNVRTLPFSSSPTAI